MLIHIHIHMVVHRMITPQPEHSALGLFWFESLPGLNFKKSDSTPRRLGAHLPEQQQGSFSQFPPCRSVCFTYAQEEAKVSHHQPKPGMVSSGPYSKTQKNYKILIAHWQNTFQSTPPQKKRLSQRSWTPIPPRSFTKMVDVVLCSLLLMGSIWL